MRWYLNGFPKSGLHLLDALLKPITQPDKPLFWGTTENTFATPEDKSLMDKLMQHLSDLPDNHRMLGHASYDERLDEFLYNAGIAHVFIYRNLKDVAVSQAHHILSPDHYHFWHPDKLPYWEMGSFEEVLSAVWNGIDGYPGVEERWRQYWRWRQSVHTLNLMYEVSVTNLWHTAEQILQYSLNRIYEITKQEYSYKDDLIKDMVNSARDTAASPTFRRGIPGEWRQYKDVMSGW